jgi:hypothetical protein
MERDEDTLDVELIDGRAVAIHYPAWSGEQMLRVELDLATAVWAYEHGWLPEAEDAEWPIPDGHEVYCRDGDPCHLDIGNLALRPICWGECGPSVTRERLKAMAQSDPLSGWLD